MKFKMTKSDFKDMITLLKGCVKEYKMKEDNKVNIFLLSKKQIAFAFNNMPFATLPIHDFRGDFEKKVFSSSDMFFRRSSLQPLIASKRSPMVSFELTDNQIILSNKDDSMSLDIEIDNLDKLKKVYGQSCFFEHVKLNENGELQGTHILVNLGDFAEKWRIFAKFKKEIVGGIIENDMLILQGNEESLFTSQFIEIKEKGKDAHLFLDRQTHEGKLFSSFVIKEENHNLTSWLKVNGKKHAEKDLRVWFSKRIKRWVELTVPLDNTPPREVERTQDVHEMVLEILEDKGQVLDRMSPNTRHSNTLFKSFPLEENLEPIFTASRVSLIKSLKEIKKFCDKDNQRAVFHINKHGIMLISSQDSDYSKNQFKRFIPCSVYLEDTLEVSINIPSLLASLTQIESDYVTFQKQKLVEVEDTHFYLFDDSACYEIQKYTKKQLSLAFDQARDEIAKSEWYLLPYLPKVMKRGF